MKNVFKSKKAIIAIFGSSFLAVSSLGIGIAMAFSNKNSYEKYFEFDGRTFNTKEELDEYIKNNISFTTKDTAQEFYLYDSKPYAVDSMYQITKDIESKSKIEELKTFKNINNYFIDTANQLSENVISSDNEKLINVYKGKDGMAYKNKNEAIQSFQDVKKEYLINDFKGESIISFENQNDAISYYENVVRQQIDEGIETDKYNVSGTDMSKEQVMQWISQTTSEEYHHGDYSWTSKNIPDSSKMKLTKDDLEKIQKFSPVSNAYWLNYDSRGLSGTLSGPQYIEADYDETTLKSKLYNGWKKVDSQPMNRMLSSLMAISAVISYRKNTVDKTDIQNWTLEIFFQALQI